MGKQNPWGNKIREETKSVRKQNPWGNKIRGETKSVGKQKSAWKQNPLGNLISQRII